jgi:hypothetical protein
MLGMEMTGEFVFRSTAFRNSKSKSIPVTGRGGPQVCTCEIERHLYKKVKLTM